MKTFPSSILLEPPNQPPFSVSLKACYHDESKRALIQVSVSDDLAKHGGDVVVQQHSCRLPCMVVLVIDESGSMDSAAVLRDDSDGCATGLSQLDIVKHACRTVVQLLGPSDQLAIVAFSSQARVVLLPTHMTDENKKTAAQAINELTPQGSTNLYDGLITALDLIRKHTVEENYLNANALLFTDGMPNVSPPSGELVALQRYMDSHPEATKTRISTFGFGYSLNSVLLQAIAKKGRSNFAFIPDSSFVGTVFVNAAANILAKALPESSLRIESAAGFSLHACLSGHDFTKTSWGLSIELPSLIYGQQHDVVVEYTNDGAASKIDPFRATLECSSFADRVLEAELQCVPPPVSNALDVDFGRAMIRSELVVLIEQVKTSWDRTQTPTGLNKKNELENDAFKSAQNHLAATKLRIAEWMKIGAVTCDMEEINKDIDGQISEALGVLDWYKKWGCHYLLSLQQAHTLQLCSNFKDPGLQIYATAKFQQFRNAAEDLFVKLPPPTPSRKVWKPNPRSSAPQYSPKAAAFSMMKYYDRSAPCFASGLVTMANGDLVQVSDIKPGDFVSTSEGAARIRCLVETKCLNGVELLVQLEDGVLVTPWHPVRAVEHGSKWSFPCDLATAPARLMPCDRVFSFVLDGAVSLRIGSYDGIALGHGICDDPVLKHAYLGTNRVIDDLAKMVGWNKGHVKLLPCPAIRDPETKQIVKLSQLDQETNVHLVYVNQPVAVDQV